MLIASQGSTTTTTPTKRPMRLLTNTPLACACSVNGKSKLLTGAHKKRPSARPTKKGNASAVGSLFQASISGN